MPAYEIDSAHQLANTIESALLPGEGALLFETARGLTGRGCIVEIGSWRGRSTIYLGYGSRNGSRATVHAIDPHTGSRESLDKFGEIDTFAEFQANIARAGIEDLVQPHVATSDVVARNWSQPVEFLFID
ncbi:MAG: hypothetical protein K0Q72_1288, partial [Armatimonadetes bacterium]|nr:hypothetical protein [Armatimonadota bacterium]